MLECSVRYETAWAIVFIEKMIAKTSQSATVRLPNRNECTILEKTSEDFASAAVLLSVMGHPIRVMDESQPS